MLWSDRDRSFLFFFNDTATTEIYTLSLHDALPILGSARVYRGDRLLTSSDWTYAKPKELLFYLLSHRSRTKEQIGVVLDRKSTRLNSSHANISYAVFCLKKKKNNIKHI